MTKEQEESLKKIKRQISIGECEKNIGISVFISDLKNVLSMLKEKDIEFIETKEANRQLSVELENKNKQIEQYMNILATNDMLHVKECEEKDQIIEQMTYYIMNLDIDEDICKRVNCDTNSGELDCKDCIKQYFKNKVKEL